MPVTTYSKDEIDVIMLGGVPLTAGATSIVDVGGNFAATNVEDALAELALSIASPAIVNAPADPESYSGTDTQKVQQAFDSGASEVRISGTYVVGQLTPAASNRLIFGHGELVQAALGTSMIVATGLSDLTWSVNMLGVAPANTSPTDTDDGFKLTDCNDITFQDFRIENFRARPIIGIGGNDITTRNVKFLGNSCGPRFIGVTTLRILDSDIIGKCLDSSWFTTGIGLESTDGWGGRSVCQDVWIRGTKTRGLGASQGILIHGGINVSIIENDVAGSTISISLNPFNSLDYIIDPIVSLNRMVGDDSLTWNPVWGGNSCLAVQAGPGTPNIVRPVVSSNIAVNGNRRKGAAGEGGFQLGYATDANVTGNVFRSSWACGMRVVDCIAANITGNDFDTVVVASGQQFGVYATGSTGLISGTFKDCGTPISHGGMNIGYLATY